MANSQKTTKRVLPKSTISANEIRHFVGDIEVASIPEVLARLNIEPDRTHSGYTYNIIHAQRDKLLPAPHIYGTTYFYPAKELEEVVLRVHESLSTKKKNSDKVKRLIEKLKTSPELAEVLLGLLD